MLLLSLLLLTACMGRTSSTPQAELPLFQQFCQFEGFDNCFPVNNVEITSATVTMKERAPLSISGLVQLPITALGKTGVEYEFTTAWGRGILVQMPGDEAFSGEIDLENDMVLHIFPCVDREECTSFGYELHSEHMPQATDEADDDTDAANVSRRLRRLLKSFTESNNPSVARKPDSASVETLRRSLQSDSMAQECDSTTCWVTLRMVFEKTWAPYPWIRQWHEQFCRVGAVLAVAEFNMAMRRSVDPVASYMKNLRMKLDAVEFTSYSSSGLQGIPLCQDYIARRPISTDLTQCVYSSERFFGRNHIDGEIWGGQGNLNGVSWVQWRGMPNAEWSKDQITLHEFGHNFGGIHEKAGPGDVMSTMPQGMGPRVYGQGFSTANAKHIKTNYGNLVFST